MDGLRAACVSTLILGLALVVISQAAPLLQQEGTISASGPDVAFSSSVQYWTDIYSTPPVQPGQTLHIAASRSGNGTVTVLVTSLRDAQNSLPQSMILIFDSGSPAFSIDMKTRVAGPYTFTVISHDASYSLTVSGVWATFYYLHTLIYLGAVFLLASALLYYYWRMARSRESVYRAAIRGTHEGGRQPQ